MRNLEQSDKDLRALLRSQVPTLGELRLREAVICMANFYRDMRDYVTEEDRDGLVFYEDVTDSGRGTRLEMGMCRLFRLPSDEADLYLPAYRLRLSLHFKCDIDVVRSVLPNGTWSLYCWSTSEVEGLLDAVRRTSGYRTMEDKIASEVKLKLEKTTYKLSALNPSADTKQNWWGVWDVA
jgi:hypothetical protein